MWAIIVTIVGGLIDFFVKRIVFSTWRFWLFFGFWVLLYTQLMMATREWLDSMLREQNVFRHEWWITGISLLPSNSVFCMTVLGLAYTLHFLVNFKRRMFAKYKESLDSK